MNLEYSPIDEEPTLCAKSILPLASALSNPLALRAGVR